VGSVWLIGVLVPVRRRGGASSGASGARGAEPDPVGDRIWRPLRRPAVATVTRKPSRPHEPARAVRRVRAGAANARGRSEATVPTVAGL